MAVTWNTKCELQTGYSADSVEWCPVEPWQHVLVCETYQLDKSDQETKDADQPKQKRLGRIYLLILDKIITEISPTQTIDTAGILDMKWCYHKIQGHPVLAVVTSDGYIQLYQLLDENGCLKLELWIEDAICGNVLALSVDWSTNKTSTAQPSLVVSDSSGAVTVFRIFGRSLEKIGYWLGHSFEAWIAAFNYWNPDVFYSGGDDCMFKSYDVRVPDVPTTTNRSHEAGVTAIRSHVHVEHQLLTGSYDEKVRLWDARNLKRCITETDVNGGVWRLKWHPSNTSVVVAACMYGGFRVLRVTDEVAVVCEYVEHESIAYGADWQFGKSTAESDDKAIAESDDKSTAESDDKSIVATCSFYDCSMHIGEIVIQKSL
ncbi:diphthine methyltransferase isoform X2 [Maniola hyperantus]|uniref:diphthine methyltransferase isoform X2 n=1 Tax=Aphantopus hyperantus TaxID=2795564 RepID=UPI0015689D3D|nr:diphthine methyltransferase isoform X2 [Maniola hyperantus]